MRYFSEGDFGRLFRRSGSPELFLSQHRGGDGRREANQGDQRERPTQIQRVGDEADYRRAEQKPEKSDRRDGRQRHPGSIVFDRPAKL